MGEASRSRKAGTYPEQTAKQRVEPVRDTSSTPEGGLDWTVDGDASDHPVLPVLLAALTDLKAGMDDTLGGKLMRVALESPEGKTVLVARTVGLGSWMNLIEAFQSCGLEDRLLDTTRHKEPFDAIFT